MHSDVLHRGLPTRTPIGGKRFLLSLPDTGSSEGVGTVCDTAVLGAYRKDTRNTTLRSKYMALVLLRKLCKRNTHAYGKDDDDGALEGQR